MIDFDAYDCDPRLPLRWRRIAILLAAVAAALALTGLAHAQEDPQPGAAYPTRHITCVERAELGPALADQYGEHPAGMGVSATGQLIELYVDPHDGSWTMAAVDPASSGRARLIGAGEGWQSAKQAEGVPS